MKRLKKIQMFDVINLLIMFAILCVVAIPLLYILATSLSSSAHIARGEVGILPKGLTFEAYQSILQSPKIPRAYLNSILYTFVSVVISLFLVVITAYPLSRKNLRGRKPVLLMIAFTMFFNGGLIPFYLLIQNLHLMDSIWALVLPWAVPAYELMLMKNYFENIPSEVYEAAKIDGASEYRTLAQVYLPMSFPILATLVMFFTRAQWNNYMIPLMYLSSPEKYPLQVILQEMLMEGQAQASEVKTSGYLNATAVKNATIVVSMIPILIVYPFVQKYFIKGVFAGAVKG